jgi:hypothetical protein
VGEIVKDQIMKDEIMEERNVEEQIAEGQTGGRPDVEERRFSAAFRR